jgi:predicted tellurium resistance membrane protein TerC
MNKGTRLMDLLCRRFISVSTSYVGNNFWTVEEGVRKATPLLLTLAVVELSDVVFAIDSIPAVCLTTLFIFLRMVRHSQ